MALTAIDFLGAGEILGAMITPALLITASGTLTMSTSNRLGRVVDRIRKLADQAEGLPDESAAVEVVEVRALIADQIGWLTQRLRLLQTALITLYSTIGLLVCASLTVGLSASTAWAVGWIPVAFGLSGATALLFAATTLVREARLAVKGTLSELDHIRKVVARKTTTKVTRYEKPEGGQGEG